MVFNLNKFFISFIDTFIRHKDILWYRTIAQLKSESRQNYLGYIWFFAEPALLTLTLYLVFGFILENRGSDFIIFLLTGLTVWQWFESSINEGLMGIKSKLHIMHQVPLPKYIFPIVHVLVTSWKFICIFTVILFFSYIFGFSPTLNYLYLPILFITNLLLVIGLVLPLAVATAYYSDIAKIVSALLRLLFYLSGVFFSTDIIPENLLKFFFLNPVACLIEAFREVIFKQQAPQMFLIYNILIWGILLCIFGLFICSKVDKKILKSVPL